ncbi:hypothetical protein BD779DRAFT_1485766 [Infundibulicybe gibba]|nr:hypothetical protein BD779DRAFT_1485766 [Infundibulicybe gibba]
MHLRLSIKAELENVVDLVPASDDFDYFFQVKCNSCHEVHPKYVSLNRKEEYEVSGGKGSKAISSGAAECKRESSAKFEAAPPKPYRGDSAQSEPLLVIECRGLEFTDFDPRGVWRCIGTTGTVFTDVDLVEGEWNDYDEKVKITYFAMFYTMIFCSPAFQSVSLKFAAHGRGLSSLIDDLDT